MPDERPAAEPSAIPPPPPPSPPSFTEFFEQSLYALALAPSVFASAAERPAPSFAATGGMALACGGAALAVNLAHAVLLDPSALDKFPPLMTAVVGAAAFGIYISFLLFLSVLFFGLARALGGAGDFSRSVQATAALSLTGPLQALCNWFSAAWILPTLIAAWMASGALEGLFKVKRMPARAVCAVLAAGAIGLQFAGRALMERAEQAYALTRAAAEVSRGNPDLAGQIRALQEQAASAAASQAGPSGLELLRGPAGDEPANQPAAVQAAALTRQAADVQQGAAGMLNAVTPMLETMAADKSLPPQQREDMKAMQDLMKDLQAQMSGKHSTLSPQEQAKRMAQIQQMTMRMMNQSLKHPPRPAAGTGDGNRK